MQGGRIKTPDALRVRINEDGTVDLMDFNLPSDSGRERNNLSQDDVPTWIMQAVSMLRITDGEHVPELGFKLSDSVYYIANIHRKE